MQRPLADLDIHLAPPFAGVVQFPDVDQRTLDDEEHPANQAMASDLWESYLHRILSPRVAEGP